MDNKEIARILDTIAKLLEVLGENPFKVRAYDNAARLVRGLPEPVGELCRRGALKGLPGIGAGLREKLEELCRTGRLEYYEKLKKSVPGGVVELLRIPHLGPKSALRLWKEQGITGVAQLAEFCRAGKLAGLKGFGARSQEKILAGIAFVSRYSGQHRLCDALPAARGLLGWLEESGLASRLSLAGSIRRGKPVIRDIDLLAAARAPQKLMERFLAAPGVAETLVAGPTKTSVRLAGGIQVDLRVVSDKQFPFALQYFTGGKEHNVALRQRAQRMGLKINEYGLFRGEKLLPAKDEAAIYARLGLDYIPPELREASGEIEAAEDGSLPELIELEDLQGAFHNHSTWSDGKASIEEMAARARAMGLKYLGLSDHSQAAHYANGLDAARLRAQRAEVRRLNARRKDFRILHGLECDILPDGRLDMEPRLLAELDFVIGSVHSRLEMERDAMTERVLRALADPNLDILGHPTGRLLLEREPSAVDLERVFDAARRHGKAVEVNGNGWRMDLEAEAARRAASKGVLLSIGPDAHSVDGIGDLELGVATARRAWLTKAAVVNTRPWKKALACLTS